MRKATILIVEDDATQRELIRQNLEEVGYEVLEAADRRQALAVLENQVVDVAVVDYRLEKETGVEVIKALLQRNPLITPIMVTAYSNVDNAVEAMKEGAYDYLVKPLDFEKFLLVLERALERQKLRQEVERLQKSIGEKFSTKNFIVASPAMEEVSFLISKAAQSEATVLISGETGTGKDVVARTIHFASRRREGPFLAVNIPALPETLIEAELFGAEKGAFTGAYERKIGKFEAAAGGTIYLDEIGDLPLPLQVKLLRVIQEREFFRVGSSRPLQADVRIIAATNRPLEELIKEGRFRSDLYYRLNVIRIHLPPLRRRKEDIPPLVDLFIRKYSAREGKEISGISREALHLLLGYSFPGNIRELENIIERAVVFCEGEIITRRDLPLFVEETREAERMTQMSAEDLPLPEKIKKLEIAEISRALKEARGKKKKAAELLGITERMLRYKLKTYGLE